MTTRLCRLWGKIGTELHLIDTYVRQDTVSGMVRWLYDLYERTRDRVAITFLMEANFMQDIILDEFAAEGNIRGYQLPILPDTRKKPEKVQRIEAVSPLWERGFVFYNEALEGFAGHGGRHRADPGSRTWLPALMMTRRMPTRPPSGICSAAHVRKFSNRWRFRVARLKIHGSMFIDNEDYKVVIGDAALKVVSQSSPENIANAEAEAIEEISGYLRPVYDTAAIFAATGNDRNRLIVMYTADIVLYHLTASQPQKMGSEIRKERYERAVKWLEGVQAGRIVPDLPLTVSDDGSAGFGTSYHSFPKLRHTTGDYGAQTEQTET